MTLCYTREQLKDKFPKKKKSALKPKTDEIETIAKILNKAKK